MRLLVTGGAGFIGSHYVRSVLAGSYPALEDAQVTVLDKLTYAGDLSNIPAEHPRLTFVRGEIGDSELLMGLLPGHDAIVHFAAESHVDRSIVGPAQFIATNVVGTHTLLECCLRAGVGRLLHVSTDEVYGSIDEGKWSEDHPLEPNSPYAASKAASDVIVRAYHKTFGLWTSTTRCGNTYGPYQHPEKLIPLFVTNLLDGQQVPLYGDGLNVREWIHVADHCRAIQTVLEHGQPGETYNIGGGTGLTNLDLTRLLLDACGADWERVRYVSDRKGHDRRYALDGSKIAGELGFRPRVPFRQGLAETVGWYRANRVWWEPVKRHRVGEGTPA